MRHFPLIAVAAFALTAACIPPAQAASRGFTFRDAEFMEDDRATAQALAFLAAEEPVGLPMADAVRRLSVAAMDCSPSRAGPGRLTCSFAMMAGGDGGTLGEDIWTVHLTADDQSRLADIHLSHERTGFRP